MFLDVLDIIQIIKINEFYLGRLPEDDNYEQFNKITNLINSNCDAPKRFNLVYSSNLEKYEIFTDSDCQNIFTITSIKAEKINDYPTEEPMSFICGGYYNYEQTECFETIPNGYFHNDTNSKIVYKCHDNCETCEKGPTNNNFNCLTCKNSKYLDLGNCVEECNNGYFNDTDGFNKCFCSSNISCKYCSLESNKYNLCLSCNNDKNYYHILNDENNIQSFFNCYNNETILDGYFLNQNLKYYEKCYSTCRKCNEAGNTNNHKCTECISTHEFKEDFENDKNCYERCNKYYYFDLSKNFYCVNECPNDFNKLIEPKNKCINNCSNDEIYKYEYENKCYQSCPPRYYNYEKTICIDHIPDGFYCNDNNKKTIDKCHDSCETCIEGPMNDNNNCLTCKNGKYFDLGNCVDKCDNGYFVDTDNITKCKCTTNIACYYCSNESKIYNLCVNCNNDIGYYPKSDEEKINNIFINCYKDPEGYFLDNINKEYKPCYSTCKKCLGNGNEENNNCYQCIFGYEF